LVNRTLAQDGPSHGHASPHVARARRALLWGLACFLAAQLGYLVLLERCRPDLRDPEYGCKLALLRAQMAAHPGRPLVLALGSSRTNMGFQPAFLPHLRTPDGAEPLVFNYAMVGSSTVHELTLLRRLLAEGIRPHVVVIEVLPLGLNNADPIESQLAVERLAWGDLRRIRRDCEHPGDLYGRWLEIELAPCYAHRFCLLSCYAPKWLANQHRQDVFWTALEPNGFLPSSLSTVDVSAQRRLIGVARQRCQAFLRDFQIGPVPDRSLRELLALCRDQGIAAALVLLPETHEFGSWYPPGARETVRTYAEHVGRQFGVPVVDASGWVPDDDFLDPHHLLVQGARVYTERLGRELLGPLVEDARTLVPAVARSRR
jgi:hypothetical protein